MIGECKAHDSSFHFRSLNHGSLADSNAGAILIVRRLRPEADIHQLTVPVETVENDPRQTYAISDLISAFAGERIMGASQNFRLHRRANRDSSSRVPWPSRSGDAGGRSRAKIARSRIGSRTG